MFQLTSLALNSITVLNLPVVFYTFNAPNDSEHALEVWLVLCRTFCMYCMCNEVQVKWQLKTLATHSTTSVQIVFPFSVLCPVLHFLRLFSLCLFWGCISNFLKSKGLCEQESFGNLFLEAMNLDHFTYVQDTPVCCSLAKSQILRHKWCENNLQIYFWLAIITTDIMIMWLAFSSKFYYLIFLGAPGWIHKY